jgi:hypothetical protein
MKKFLLMFSINICGMNLQQVDITIDNCKKVEEFLIAITNNIENELENFKVSKDKLIADKTIKKWICQYTRQTNPLYVPIIDLCQITDFTLKPQIGNFYFKKELNLDFSFCYFIGKNLLELKIENNNDQLLQACIVNSINIVECINKSYLPNLKKLHIINGRLEMLDISKYNNLYEVNLNNNNLKCFPIFNLETTLEKLSLCKNEFLTLNLDELPKKIREFHLRENYTNSRNENNLESIILQVTIKQMHSSLQILFLDQNNIQVLDGLHFLQNLKTLDVNKNHIQKLDVSLNKNLIYLDCSYNFIKKLYLCENNIIKIIYMYNNKLPLETVCKILSNLPCLIKLYTDHYQMSEREELSHIITTRLSKLEVIYEISYDYDEENEINRPRVFILSKGNSIKNIKEYESIQECKPVFYGSDKKNLFEFILNPNSRGPSIRMRRKCPNLQTIN